MTELANFTKNLALAGACFGLIAVPVPWPISVDDALARRAASPKLGRPLSH